MAGGDVPSDGISLGWISIGASPKGELWNWDVDTFFLINLRERGDDLFGSGASSEGEQWVWDPVAQDLVDLRERREDFLGSVAWFCSSSLGLSVDF